MEQNPLHAYKEPGNKTVTLIVRNRDGAESRFARVWDVTLP